MMVQYLRCLSLETTVNLANSGFTNFMHFASLKKLCLTILLDRIFQCIVPTWVDRTNLSTDLPKLVLSQETFRILF